MIYESSLVKVVGKEISLKDCLLWPNFWRLCQPANTNPLKSAGALYNFHFILWFNSENLSRRKYTDFSLGMEKEEASIQPNLEHLSQYLMPYWLDTCITKQCCKSDDTISNISEHQRDVIYEVNKQVLLQFATWQTEAVVRSNPSLPPPSHVHKS